MTNTRDFIEVIGPLDTPVAAFAHYAVSAERPEVGRAGVHVLDGGGNAVDAAVAMAFATCVVQPSATSIAGSGFLLVDRPDAEPLCVDFGPRAPRRATPDMYELVAGECRDARIMGLSAVRNRANAEGAMAVGVPGTVAGLCAAQERFGRLDLAEVLAPAVELADCGFAVTPEYQLNALAVLPALRHAGADVCGTLLNADGLPPGGSPALELPDAEAPRVRQPGLAATLRRIAEHGHNGFYEGPAARAIIEAVALRGGILGHDDLQRYRVEITTPLSLDVAGHRIYAPSAPSGGWTQLQMLGVIARLPASVREEPALAAVAWVKVSRRCFADRYHFMADPDQVEVPLDELLHPSYLNHLAEDVVATLEHPAQAGADGVEPWAYYADHRPDLFERHWGAAPTLTIQGGSAGLGDHHETAQLCVADADGMMVSCTLTVGDAFGSKVLAAGCLLDNAMIWFNAAPGRANSIAGGKRPLVNMGPTIVARADHARAAIGAPGGRRIPSAVAQTAWTWLNRASLGAAIGQGRIDASGSEVLVSVRAGDRPMNELINRGFRARAVEDRLHFSYELARPNAVAMDRDGTRWAAAQPFCSGYIAGR